MPSFTWRRDCAEFVEEAAKDGVTTLSLPEVQTTDDSVSALVGRARLRGMAQQLLKDGFEAFYEHHSTEMLIAFLLSKVSEVAEVIDRASVLANMLFLMTGRIDVAGDIAAYETEREMNDYFASQVAASRARSDAYEAEEHGEDASS